MAYRLDENTGEIIIDGFEDGIASSPYKGIANIRNLNTSYYPGVAYVNYRRRQASTPSITDTITQDSFNQGNSNSQSVAVLVVAGGGGGAGSDPGAPGGGGGAGGYQYSASTAVTIQAYTITVGTGGAGGAGSGSGSVGAGTSGNTSSGLGLSATGGGGGGRRRAGLNGGSGGGGEPTGGTGSQGFNGGNEAVGSTNAGNAGGGGAGAVGADVTTSPSAGGNGGVGLSNSISGAAVFYAGGGGGGGGLNNAGGTGGNGGGGAGAPGNGAGGGIGTAGTANTGGGGGGAGAQSNSAGGAGGSGIVIISYPTGTITATGGTITTSGSNTIHTFTTGGTWTITAIVTTTVSYTHTCGTNKNRLLIVATQVQNSDTISSLTYNGVAMTQLGSSVQGKDTTQKIALYGLLNPTSGANTLLLTRSGTTGNFGMFSVSYYNVKQSGLPDASTTNTGTTTVTTTLTTIADQAYVIAYTASAATVSVSTNSTSIGAPNWTDATSYLLSRFTSNPKTPAGSVAMTNLTSTGGSAIGQAMISIAPYVHTMTNPVQKATSEAGINYVLDDSGQIWKQSAVNSSTFNYLADGTGRFAHGAGGLAYWNKYLVVFGSGVIEFCGDGTGDSGITSANWNTSSATIATASTTFTTNFGSDTHKLTYATTPFDTAFRFVVNTPVRFTSTGTLPTGLSLNTTYYVYSTDGFTYITVSTNPGDTQVVLSSNGTGTHTVTIQNSPVPLGNATNLSLYLTGNPSWSSGTFQPGSSLYGSYVDPIGNTITGSWQGATGTYFIIYSDGTTIPALFTYGSATVTFSSAVSYSITGTWNLRLLDPNVTNYRPYVSKVDGSLYFCNGQYLGRIAVSTSPNLVFNPLVPETYSVSYGVTKIPSVSDSLVDMTDLKSNLVIAGLQDLYTWDYNSSTTSSPSPVGERIYSIANDLSNIYILAGKKGSIYISNGYSSSLFRKIPDYISGDIDPVWLWGGVMVHRSKLMFQAIAQSKTGTNLMAGTFALTVAPTDNEKSALVVDSQNSYGLTPTSGALANGILMDNQTWSSGEDSYYSAWSNGATTGGIDYNDTSLWQNAEPIIETDIIPIGNVLNLRTLGNIQFKLDRPMVTGDSISLYWRANLTDSYTLCGTTTTAVLADYVKSNVAQAQWAQFKPVFTSASSGSSRIPLREIRIQTK